MNLKKLRKNKQESQTDLSKSMSVSLKTIQNWENESVTIPNKRLKDLAKHYNVNVFELFSSKKIELKNIPIKDLALLVFENWSELMSDKYFNLFFKNKATEWLKDDLTNQK
jgi:transcriptional regulator with XRE-family HTH domain